MKTFLIVLTVLLSACAPLDGSNTVVTANHPGPTYYVHDVRLKDDTRCVVSTTNSYDGGTGIACDWDGWSKPE